VDAVNHFFGPSSLENEDVVLQLDRTLADLFGFIDNTVGLKNTLIVFSADHGMADMPEYMTELGFVAGRLYPEDIIKTANDLGKQQFGVDGVVRFFFRPYLYLDDVKISTANLDRTAVEQAIAGVLMEKEGIELAVSRSGLSGGHARELLERIGLNFHDYRSGDIYVAQKPYWFLYEKGPVVAMHGSLWKYDSHVPIFFAGPGIPMQRVHRLIHPVDVASTMAAYLGMTPPSSSQGHPLKEVLE